MRSYLRVVGVAGILATVAYVAVVAVANWAIRRWGVVPVGFGQKAPAAVYFVGLALVLRNGVQVAWATATRSPLAGRLVMLGALAAGVGVSYWTSSAGVATASAAAFACSESIDFATFTVVALWRARRDVLGVRRPRWSRAVVAAGAVGAVVDTYVFLTVAPTLVPHVSNYHFAPGQLVGKGYGVAAALVVTWCLLALGVHRDESVEASPRVAEHALA